MIIHKDNTTMIHKDNTMMIHKDNYNDDTQGQLQ